jgi:hypothetical protein
LLSSSGLRDRRRRPEQPHKLSGEKDFLRKGDVLMVHRIDRLAGSIGDLEDIVRAVRTRGAALKATEQPIDPIRPQRHIPNSIATAAIRDPLPVIGVPLFGPAAAVFLRPPE